jgi:hypothetical protein
MIMPEAEVNPYQAYIDGKLAVDEALSTVETDWGGPVESALNLATGQFTGFKHESIIALDAIRTKFETLGNMSMTIEVNTSFGEGATHGESGVGGGYQLAEYQAGGFTGHGGADRVAGIVHREEYVVPRGGALVLRDGGGGKQDPLQVQLFMNSRVIYDETIREGRRRNKIT